MVVAFAGIIGFMVFIYGFFGMVASVALVMNMVLTDRAPEPCSGRR